VNPIKNKKDLQATIDELRKFAYSYLEKFNSSKQQLRIYLFKKFIKKKYKLYNKKEIFSLIDEVILGLEKNKVISDKYYSENKARSFFRRGYSLNKIRYNLIKKGINEDFINSSISKIKEDEIDPDFFSAIKICKKKKIGPSRVEGNRSLYFKKDISYLARSGFGYDVSKKVLEISKSEYKKLCKMI